MEASASNTASSSTPTCGNCDKTTQVDGSPLLRCSICKDQLYCSKGCQTKHWQAHKVACKGKSGKSTPKKPKAKEPSVFELGNATRREVPKSNAPSSPNNAICGAPQCNRTTAPDGGNMIRCRGCTQMYCSWDHQINDCFAHAVVCRNKTFATKPQRPGNKNPTIWDYSDISGVGIYMDLEPEQEALAEGNRQWDMTPVPAHHIIAQAPEVPISKLIGFPLRLEYHTGTQVGSLLRNTFIEALVTDIDPSSPNFGKPFQNPPPTGAAFFRRSDGRDIQMNHISIVVQFCSMVAKEISELKQKEAKGETPDRKALLARLLSPKAFKRFFEGVKEELVETLGLKEWEAVECPVEA